MASSLSLWSVPEVLVAVGAHGNEEFGQKFTRWANAWKDACSKGGATFSMIEKPIGDTSPREQIKAWLSSRSDGDSSLWIIFIGHGTFDGKRAKLNLRGPDVSATELAAWIKPVKAPVVFFNTASSSSPFISAISGANRVIITATRSGGEQILPALESIYQLLSAMQTPILTRMARPPCWKPFLWHLVNSQTSMMLKVV